MRKFTSVCIDNKTGKEIVLSEASYNMACSFLESEGFNVETIFIDSMNFGIVNLIGTFKDGIQRTFIYDEERGMLFKDF